MSSEVTPEQVGELAGKATAAPFAVVTSRDVFAAVISPCIATIASDFENEADAYFFVCARNNWPRHASELLELKREAARLREALKRVNFEAESLAINNNCFSLDAILDDHACSYCEIVHVVHEALSPNPKEGQPE
jgi:hypothetical protein